MLHYKLLFTFAFLIVIDYSIAQVTNTGKFSIQKIDTWKLQSKTIGEEYTIYVMKTDDYDTSSKKYGVLYMTDGDWNMTVAMNCFSMLRQDYATNEPLVVGIGYGKNENKRVRDLDPKTGGPAFLKFIEQEVMPFVDSAYRTNNERSIYGYSMGGMFTTYTLFNRPDLFRNIFIGAPGNNGYELMPAARKYFADHTGLAGNVYIGVGNLERQTLRNIDSFTTYMRSKKLKDFEIHSVFTPDANHGAALAQVMQNGIKYVYCKTHERIAANTAKFAEYSGQYEYSENGKVQETMKVYSKAGRLYMLWGAPQAIAEELVPSGKDQFFISSYEWFTFNFINGGILLEEANTNKEYRWQKKSSVNSK